MTAEDPVEFNLLGVNQVQVRENIGLNFAAALRSLPAAGPQHHPRRRNPRLRNRGNRGQGGAHRPPGAVDAAHQRRAEHGQPPDEHGHRAVPGGQLGEPDLRPAPGAPRLRATARSRTRTPPPALIAGRLLAGGCAARSCRCKGTGCEKCNNTGYKGRVGLYEVMEVTDELRELILVGASALELRRKAIEEGMITLRGRAACARSRRASRRSRKWCRETVKIDTWTTADWTTYGNATGTAEDDGGAGGLGPAPDDRHAAAGARARQARSGSSCRT